MNKLTKSYDTGIEDIKEGSREVVAVISTDGIDRDNEVVRPQGMKKKNFAGNPVVMVNHDYQTLPIAKALWVKSDGNRVLAKYKVSDATQQARDVFGLLQDGTISAHSIGFVSNYASPPTTAEKNARPDLSGAKLIHRDWELLEFSVVGIPANPEALTLAVAKGCSAETIDFLSNKTNKEKGIENEIIEQAKREIGEVDSRKAWNEAVSRAAEQLKRTVDVDRIVSAAIKNIRQGM